MILDSLGYELYGYEVEAKSGERTGREEKAPCCTAVKENPYQKNSLPFAQNCDEMCQHQTGCEGQSGRRAGVWVVHGWGEAKMEILCLGRQ